jgi:hypothetical protein
MPVCTALETLEGEIDECAVTVLIVAKRPWRAVGDPCIEEDRVAVFALAVDVQAAIIESFPALEPRPKEPIYERHPAPGESHADYRWASRGHPAYHVRRWKLARRWMLRTRARRWVQYTT